MQQPTSSRPIADGAQLSPVGVSKKYSYCRADRVVLATITVLGGIGLIAPAQLPISLVFTASNILAILPFLVLSALTAAYLKAAGADLLIGRVFSQRLEIAIILAALIGGLSPFCSCGVIPLIAALLAAGVPLPAVMAFWVASPIMDPEMYILTLAGLGLEFSIAKTITAVAIGSLAGAATLLLQKLGAFQQPLRESVTSGGCGSASLRSGDTVWLFWRDETRFRQFWQQGLQTSLFLGKWLVFAYVLESLMVSYLPPELLTRWLGEDSAWAIPLAAIIGVPAYLNGYAAIPVVSGLLDGGMQPGAALAFMTAGAMTSLPAAIAVFSLVRRPLFVWYISVALTGATLAGWLFQQYLS